MKIFYIRTISTAKDRPFNTFISYISAYIIFIIGAQYKTPVSAIFGVKLEHGLAGCARAGKEIQDQVALFGDAQQLLYKRRGLWKAETFKA